MGTTKIYGNANALTSYNNPSAHLGSSFSYDNRNYSDSRYRPHCRAAERRLHASKCWTAE